MTDWVFETQDRDDNTVRLSRTRWNRHILVKHREVGQYLAETQDVILSSTIGTVDGGGAYHLSTLGAVGGKWKNLYLEVVVRYEDTGDTKTGTVPTIHFNDSAPKGDLRWLVKP